MSRAGTKPEDLMDIVIANDALRRRALGYAPTRYYPAQRVWIEPWFNALGRLFGLLTLLVPWPLRGRMYLAFCRMMQGHAGEENPDLPAMIERSRQQARDLYERTGQWPACLLLTSHPETIGPTAWLRFELLRQGLIVANALEDDRRRLVPEAARGLSHPQCFVAIDPYALDTVPASVGGFYSGWMRQVYIAWDRQPSTQSWIQRHFLLRGSGHASIAWRLLGCLKQNPVLMVLSGGLPYNARLLYAAREFVHSLKPARWPFPKVEAERRLMEILMRPVNGIRCAEKGEIPQETERAIRDLLKTIRISDADAAFQTLAGELCRPVPLRRRLFNVLLKRLVRRGCPLLVWGISHREQPPRVQFSGPLVIGTETPSQRPEDLAATVGNWFT